MNDYSAALPHAQIILVNYGPVSGAVERAISALRSQRCKAFGAVDPEDLGSRTAFEKLVYQTVEPPAPTPFREDKPLAGLGGCPILMVDVSLSMRAILAQAQARSLMKMLLRTNNIQTIVAADDRQLVETGLTPNEIASAIAATGTGSTSLSSPVRELLGCFTGVIILTDSEGARQISGFSRVQKDKLRLGDAEAFLISVTRQS